MPNTGQRARTSLLFTQIPISCFTWEPFKGSLMVSSSSLTPSELSNPYLETRAKSYQKQQVSLSEPRNTSLPYDSPLPRFSLYKPTSQNTRSPA